MAWADRSQGRSLSPLPMVLHLEVHPAALQVLTGGNAMVQGGRGRWYASFRWRGAKRFWKNSIKWVNDQAVRPMNKTLTRDASIRLDRTRKVQIRDNNF